MAQAQLRWESLPDNYRNINALQPAILARVDCILKSLVGDLVLLYK